MGATTRRMRAGRGELLDAAVAVVLVALTLPATFDPDTGGRGTVVGALLLPTLALALPLRRRAPALAGGVYAAGAVISAVPTFDQFRITVAIPVALLVAWSVGARLPGGRASAGLVAILAGVVVVGLTDSAVQGSGGGGLAGTVEFVFPLAAGTWGTGRIVRSRERLAAQLRARTQELERRRDATAAVAVELERTRLAAALDRSAHRRLRDLVALADADGADAFAQLERHGRALLDELRELLGVLRREAQGAPEPPPTLDRLERLLGDARAGGRPVALAVTGERRPLSPTVELAAYRVIEHALAAAEDGAAAVRLHYAARTLEIGVDGTPRRGAPATAALAAARERVAVYGGRVRTEDAAVLAASLPVTDGG